MAKEHSNSLKIRRLPYSRLLKAETADYSERVISIIEEHKPKSPFINQLFGLLLKKRGDINLLRLNYGVDTERLKVKKQKEKMLLIISMFKLKAKMLDDAIEESHLQVLTNAIKTHLCYLHKCKNDKVLNQKIAGFFDMVAKSEPLAAVIDKHGLIDEFDQVYNAHKKFNSIVKRRIELLSKRPKVSSRAISKDLLSRIDHLFQGVELAYIVSLEDDVDADADTDADSHEELALLIKTLNQLSEMYYKSAKLREQNNRRNAAKEDNKNSDSVVPNKMTAEANIGELVSNSNSTPTDADFDADIDIDIDSLNVGVDTHADSYDSGVSVEVDVNRDTTVEPPLIKRVANSTNHNSTLLLRGDPSKEYH